MGNCFGKGKLNRVSPDPNTDEDGDVSGIIGRSTPFQKPSPRQQQDMVKDLAEKGQEPSVSKGGVAFVVDFQEGNSERMPSRLADRLDGVQDDEGEKNKREVEYTSEEKELLAELMREDVLQERRENAGKEEEKIRQAAQRREEYVQSRMEGRTYNKKIIQSKKRDDQTEEGK